MCKTGCGQQIIDEKIEISMDFTNDTDVQQPFALIVQIKDSNNTTISLSHVTGMLGAGQTLEQILSYTPTETGIYTVEKFLWDNFADTSTALTDEKEIFTLTVSYRNLIYKSYSIFYCTQTFHFHLNQIPIFKKRKIRIS